MPATRTGAPATAAREQPPNMSGPGRRGGCCSRGSWHSHAPVLTASCPCPAQPAQAAHLLQDILGLLGDPAGIMRRVHSDGLEKLVLVVAVEGGLANEHLVEEDSEGPPVHGEGVLLALQDLRREKERELSGVGARARPGLLALLAGADTPVSGRPSWAPLLSEVSAWAGGGAGGWAAASSPRGRCSQGYRRRCWPSYPRICSLCTSRSRRS